MKASCYLVIQGVKVSRWSEERKLGTIKIAKRNPSTAADEIAVKLDLDIPDAIFSKPVLSAAINVPEGQTYAETITTEVMDNLAQIIQEQTGIRLKIQPAEDQS